MGIVRRFLPFTLLFIIQESVIQCQDETEKTSKENNDTNQLTLEGYRKLFTINNLEDEVKDIFNTDYYNPRIRYFRSKRSPSPPANIAAIRKKLNDERKKEEMMAADANPRLEPNDTNAAKISDPNFDYGLKHRNTNFEQLYNKQIDKIRMLHHQHTLEKLNQFESGVDCDFENDCLWTWRKDIVNGFFITSGSKYGAHESGPRTDADNSEGGSFLLLRPNLKSTEFHVHSPPFAPTVSSCKFAVWIYQEKMEGGTIRIVGSKSEDGTQWLLKKIPGDNSREWHKYDMSVGNISKNFTIILEVVPFENMEIGAAVAFDNIQLFQCYHKNDYSCSALHYKCKATKICINSTSICDITKDCMHGDDETQNCDQMPFGSRCNFEDDWCGWQNVHVKYLKWIRYNGSTPTNLTGPNIDHTYKNRTGKYLFINMFADKDQFATSATIRSVDFNPPPRVHGNSSSRFYNSCAIRFYLHKNGAHKSALLLQVTELRPSENVSTEMLWSYDDHGHQWVRQVFILPNITHRYFIRFEARKGIRYKSYIAIDDVSLSPECFGLNIPKDDLNGYNYWDVREEPETIKETHKDFLNKTIYKITTCNAKGRFGPTQPDCTKAYNGTNVHIKVVHEPGLTGVQKWVVPVTGYYTFILAGASGGKGSSSMGSTKGAVLRTVLELKEGTEIYMLIGQEGTSSCVKSLGSQRNSSCHSNQSFGTGIRGVLNLSINDSGGGGGGGTFIFLRTRNKEKIPLAVAGGGGGLGLGHFSVDNVEQHGRGINKTKLPFTGQMYRKNAGAGGGWKMYPGLVDPLHKIMMGSSLLAGGIGGKACYNSTDERGDGGFGGGGGGCAYGGGGGGFAGGNAPSTNSTNGEGGYSYLDFSKALSQLTFVESGSNTGSGYVLIIPEIDGCQCDYKCIALDDRRSEVTCICPNKWILSEDKKTCKPLDDSPTESPYPTWFVVVLIVTVFCLTGAFAVVCFVLYNRYQLRATGIMRRKMITGADLQLDRLRMTSDSMMTEYNPNYEFGGVVYTLKDLKDIPREQLRLVKALGQGAFGEVYQGFYRQRPCDTVEMPVAVKTLPEMSTSQAEMDFLMEALIMSKFNHPNIVHFIGVCFDKHPRFIVLELLAGGDLKNFLRESRPKPERTSPLSMKDLVLISVDVAKGCKYLEDNRFIHRDIAARNCLLTTKGPGRVVKIADFGMSRDVYRSDYYRKGGKAMLPIKWMPPEAFLDGIFTSKTDVWSFGVLLWEIMSMGYMPYTGCANRDVMQLVTSGGRLEPPANCPGPIYGIMTQCWHPAPEHRPTFGTILERLGYCVQDPQVMSAPLPVFQRPPSYERDTTVMRPSGSEENCLQVIPTSSDYLIPNHTNPTTPDQIESTSSVEKLLPDNSDNWETSFIMPHSRSTQPLLLEHIKEDEGASVDKLLTIDNSAANPKVSPMSLPGNILTQSNHNNNTQNDYSLKSGVSLDAGALAKQAMMPQINKYANISTGDGPTSNGVLQNDPFANHISSAQKTEINC
ncbi:tyrosine-protein kinase receptor isoform X1 [Diorhabda carinulata]|uniref:tyrosine-protein kinase receptor isoform X1 n=2 Tax=Diorhabda carinulata TaxID=1163345 RepID=UPI0025A0E576|nr:tyrosine-protein kinase receptor isoform X1 [Diorhabda carinulata]